LQKAFNCERSVAGSAAIQLIKNAFSEIIWIAMSLRFL